MEGVERLIRVMHLGLFVKRGDGANPQIAYCLHHGVVCVSCRHVEDYYLKTALMNGFE